MAGLWDFACDLYGRDGVRSALLALQDERGLNIPLLLFCLWRGYGAGALTPEELTGAMALADELTTAVIQPVRQARRWSKAHLGEAEALLHQLQAAELACERHLLATLEARWGNSARPAPVGRPQAEGNAIAYLSAAGIAEVEKRLAAVFDQLTA